MQKSIFITGCSSGVGLTTARALKKRGYYVIVSCRKACDISFLQQEGFDVVELDLDNSDSIIQAANRVLELTNRQLYALFNNAGFGVYGPLMTISRQQLEQQFSTNFFGLHQLTQLLLPAMIANQSGRIIQTSSVMGIVSTRGRGAYAASKYAVEAWSDALRLEHYMNGIKVCLIEPGPLATSFKQNVNQTQTDNPVDNPPIAKRFGLPAEAVLPKIYHALESNRPKIRYRVTLLTTGTMLLKRLLPDRLMDWVLRKN